MKKEKNWLDRASSPNQENSLHEKLVNLTIKSWKEIKKKGFSNENLLVKESEGKGLGVFAKKKIQKDQVIEFCHCIVMDWKKKYVHDRNIIKYAYWQPCDCQDCLKHGNAGLILLGNGSIYNSADSDELANCMFNLYPSQNLAVLSSTKDIEENEEILTWWGQKYYDSWCKKDNTNENKAPFHKNEK